MNGLGASSGMDKEKLTKVLSYMKDHNREHARELRGLLDSAGELGSLDIADLVENGATSIDEAADNIEIAIELLANS
jgi:hypothetical protein